MAPNNRHYTIMRLALDEARKCEPVVTAFCVGCVLTVPGPQDQDCTVVSTGYSRELPGNTHAEANALAKLRNLSPEQLQPLLPHTSLEDILSQLDVYTTLEPCSIRTSGLAPCADSLIEVGIKRCFIGVGEPTDFVQCEGAQKMIDAGIEVVWLSGMESECLSVARRGHNNKF